MDIVYSNCTSMGSYLYGLLLVDVATQYYYFYGLKSATSKNIINALSQLHADVGTLPRRFHANFGQKIMGGKCL